MAPGRISFVPRLPTVMILLALFISLLARTSDAQGYSAGPVVRHTRSVDTPGGQAGADIVVAKDGSGDFTTVQAALDAVRPGTPSRWSVIYIESGVYWERVVMNESLHHVMLVGANGRKGDRAKITFAKTMPSGGGLDDSATFRLLANDVVVWNVVFENAYGPGDMGGRAEQALAIQVEGTRVAFFQCTFLGYQDTLYAANGLQYYRSCTIFGRMDFVFGNAKAVFDQCRFRLVYWGGAYFAQAREQGEDTGFVVWGGSLSPYGKGPIRPGYLARAWGAYSTVVFVKTYFDVGSVREEGWSYVGGYSNTQNVIFGAYKCYGPGYNSSLWEHNGREMSAAEAAPYMSPDYVNKDKWIPYDPINLMPAAGSTAVGGVGAARDPNSPVQSIGAHGQRQARGTGSAGRGSSSGGTSRGHSPSPSPVHSSGGTAKGHRSPRNATTGTGTHGNTT
ncbi:unnamed protein product [Closterium sp. Yama58-4]|nr:unnamed protein product [Closterium sp. Yama58-4]